MEKIIAALENLKEYCEKLNLNDSTIRRKLHIFCMDIEAELKSGWKHSGSVLEDEKVEINELYSGILAGVERVTTSIIRDDAESIKAFNILTQLAIVIKAAGSLKDKLIKLESRIEFEETELKKMLADL